MAEYMSRPCSSLPIQSVNPAVAFIPGASLESRMSSCARLYGFCGVTHGAKTAASRITTSAISAATASRSRAKPAVNSLNGACAAIIDYSSPVTRHRSCAASCQSQRRVQCRVNECNTEIKQHNQQQDDQQVGHKRRPVQHVARVDEQLSHAGPGEDGFGHDRERDHRPELEAGHGHDRDHDVLE